MAEEVKEKAEKKEETPAKEEASKEEASAKEDVSREDAPVVEGKMAEFIDWIEGISVLELSRLVKALEDRLGVTAAAPIAMAGVMAGAPGAGAEGGADSEQTEFTVVLAGAGDKKIGVIKEVRTITGLGLKDSKDLVEGAPKPVKEGVTKEEAEEIKKQLESAGATVEIK